jgi:DNA-binding transcriptional ArsR family regulator
MSSLFPLRGQVELDDGREPRLVDLNEEVADEVFEALAAGTTRKIFAELHETPATASDLADVTDTSVQNVQYHLRKLRDADLVEVVDTWYSERGTEMKVYAPTDESLVLFAGGNKRRSLRSLLERVVGIVAVLLPLAAMVAWFADRLGPATTRERAGQYASGDGGDPAADGGVDVAMTGGDGGSDAAGGATPAPEVPSTAAPDGGSVSTPADVTLESVNGSTPAPGEQVADVVTETAGGAGLDPALLAGGAFLLGGILVLALVVGTWYWRP